MPIGSIVLEMLKSDQIYIVENTLLDPLFKRSRFTKDEQVISCIGIPLQVGSETVGVMFVNYRLLHRFTPDELTNIELFANQAAVAIRNAQLYGQLNKRAAALQALYDAGRAVSNSLDLNTTLVAIAEQGWRLTGTDGPLARFCHLALVRENKLEFIAANQPELLDPIREKLGTIDLDRREPIGVTGRAVKTGRSQLIGDVTQNNPDYLAYDEQTHSELAVPIKIGDTMIGVINVEHPDYNAFDAEDQRALEALAAQAAIAIQHARLYEQIQQRADQLRALYDAGLKLTSALSVNEVLQEVVDRARELTNARHGALSVRNSESGISRFLTSGLTPEQKTDIGAPPAGHGVLERLLQGSEPIRERNIRALMSDRSYPVRHPDIISFLGVSIAYQGRCIGNLYMGDKRGAVEFSQEDQYVLELLASQAAVAIENARLFEQTKHDLEKQSLLHQVALAASSALDLDKVLQATAESIRQSLNYESIGIHLVAPACFGWAEAWLPL